MSTSFSSSHSTSWCSKFLTNAHHFISPTSSDSYRSNFPVSVRRTKINVGHLQEIFE
ncbi:unnamed protein product [Acanthoscelides obtectus]|uniref:Uncharacterized protein n=1 Tax=Acanthoscelides obtectus TaxID=200917 RepID=A0A9P0M4L4_ACAOB|nr:unnamed protein product [Acanthoscelides obtectus]CAK1658517.1 hypothetical protein AOBTE_LOCUS20953 [Acanthoscelides obtectus]